MSLLENRIPPPFVTLIVAAAMGGAAHLSPPLAMGGTLRYALVIAFFLLAALFGFPAVRAFVRAGTTIEPVRVERASKLVSSGVYGVTRNPMYVAMTCLLLSWACYLAAPWTFLGPLLFALFINRFQIVPEERAMMARFGVEYGDYKGRVRRWL